MQVTPAAPGLTRAARRALAVVQVILNRALVRFRCAGFLCCGGDQLIGVACVRSLRERGRELQLQRWLLQEWHSVRWQWHE